MKNSWQLATKSSIMITSINTLLKDFEMSKETEFKEIHGEIVRAIITKARQQVNLTSESVLSAVKLMFPKATKKDFKIATTFIAENIK